MTSWDIEMTERCGQPRRSPRSCDPGDRISPGLRDYAEVVSDYIRMWRPEARGELEFYAGQASLAEAVRVAALAIAPDGKRHPHQRRIPCAVLATARHHLSSADLDKQADFEALYELVQNVIQPIPGIGELTVYDTAQRLGAYLGVLPKRVYLHAGTRAGARALGLDVRGRHTLEIDELPSSFNRLEPYEVEDCLCLYKAQLAGVSER